jgi:hypothetical protein
MPLYGSMNSSAVGRVLLSDPTVLSQRKSLNIDQITMISDSNTLITSAIESICLSSITASRTFTLNLASTFNPGQTIYIFDKTGQLSNTQSLTIITSGSDLINNTSNVVLDTPYSYLTLITDGINSWTVVSSTSTSSNGSSTITSASNIALTNTSTILQLISMTSSTELTVSLPNATSLVLGLLFIIKNTGSNRFRLLDNSGNIVSIVNPNQSIIVSCANNTSVAGTWVIGNISADSKPLSSVYQGLSYILNSTSTTYINSTSLTSNSILLVYSTSSTNLYAVVLTTLDSTISSGTPISIPLYTSSLFNSASLVTLSSTSVLMCITTSLSDFYTGALPLSIFGSTITLGSFNQFFIDTRSTYNPLAVLTSTTAVLNYADNTTGNPYSVVLTLQPIEDIGSIGTTYNYLSNVLYNSTVSISSTNQLVVFSTATQVEATILTTSGNTILNPGSPVVIFTGVCTSISAVTLSPTSVLAIFSTSTNIYGVILSVSGTVITTNTIFTLLSGSTITNTDISLLTNSTGVISYNQLTNYTYYLPFSIAGNNIIIGTNSSSIVTYGLSSITPLTTTTALSLVSNSSYQGSSSILTYSNNRSIYGSLYSVGVSYGTTNLISITPLTNTTSLAVWYDTTHGKLAATVVTNTGLTTSIGTIVESTSAYSIISISSCTISNTKTLCVFSTSSATYGLVINISGTVASLGPVNTIGATGITNLNLVNCNNTTSVLSYTYLGSVYGVVVSISGTSVTIGSPLSLGVGVQANLAPLNSSEVFILYGPATATSLIGNILIVTGTTLSAGTSATMTGLNASSSTLVALSSSSVIAVSYNSSNNLVSCNFTISGTAVTAHTNTVSSISNYSSCPISSVLIDSNDILVFYSSASNLTSSVSISLSGTTCTFGASDPTPSHNYINKFSGSNVGSSLGIFAVTDLSNYLYFGSYVAGLGPSVTSSGTTIIDTNNCTNTSIIALTSSLAISMTIHSSSVTYSLLRISSGTISIVSSITENITVSTSNLFYISSNAVLIVCNGFIRIISTNGTSLFLGSFYSVSSTYVSAALISSNYLLLNYTNGTSFNNEIININPSSNTTMSGIPLQLYSSSVPTSNLYSLSNNLVLSTIPIDDYNQVYQLLSISGTTITSLGQNSLALASNILTIPLTSTTLLIVYYKLDNVLYGTIGTISGGIITTNTPVIIYNGYTSQEVVSNLNYVVLSNTSVLLTWDTGVLLTWGPYSNSMYDTKINLVTINGLTINTKIINSLTNIASVWNLSLSKLSSSSALISYVGFANNYLSSSVLEIVLS